MTTTAQNTGEDWNEYVELLQLTECKLCNQLPNFQIARANFAHTRNEKILRAQSPLWKNEAGLFWQTANCWGETFFRGL